jgi:hypothetical protein
MNERIREFARTSHLDVYGLGKDRAKWEDTLEKFAELIVRECARQVNCYEALNIFEHFGVEE